LKESFSKPQISPVFHGSNGEILLPLSNGR